MSVERPHEDRLGTGGSTTTEVLTRTGTGTADWLEPTPVADILDLPTAETDASLVLAPDGTGGVEFRAETGGGGGSGGSIDLITGNDSTFAASLGSWAASGGTMTRDTGVKLPGFTASLKHVTSAVNQYVELAISGTFSAGVQYWAVLLIQPPSLVAPVITLGLIGTDSAARTITITGTDFQAIGVPWTPTADRTGVKLRLLMPASGTTYYIGWAKAFVSMAVPMLNNEVAGSESRIYVPLGSNNGIALGAHTGTSGTGLLFGYDGPVTMSGSDGKTGFTANTGAYGYSSIWSEHTPADLAGEGLEINVGTDYVGLYISEKNSSTIQIYDDAGGAYNVELVEQDAAFHFKLVHVDGGIAIPTLGMLPQYGSAPHSGTETEGETYYDTTLHAARFWDGSAWNDLSGGGSTPTRTFAFFGS